MSLNFLSKILLLRFVKKKKKTTNDKFLSLSVTTLPNIPLAYVYIYTYNLYIC